MQSLMQKCVQNGLSNDGPDAALEDGLDRWLSGGIEGTFTLKAIEDAQ